MKQLPNMLSFLTDLPHPYNKIGDGPEGPEVRTVADQLRPHLVGCLISLLEIKPGGRISYPERLPGTVTRVSSHGKKIICHLDTGRYIIISLGMTGRVQFQPGDHSNIILSLSNNQLLYFDDQRHMGQIEILTHAEWSDKAADLGPDLLQEEITAPTWNKIFYQRSARKLCDILTDQKLVAGIGWYLMTDILYLAGLHPLRGGKTVSAEQWELVRVLSHRLIRESYQAGGFTIRDYISPNGQEGGYRSYLYGNKEIEQTVTHEKLTSGRTVHYVAAVQK